MSEQKKKWKVVSKKKTIEKKEWNSLTKTEKDEILYKLAKIHGLVK